MATKQVNKPTVPTKNVPALMKGMDIIQSDTTPDYIKNANRGSENVGTEDLVIPRLEIVQALSPAIKKNDPKFIAGAEIGNLTNSVTRELLGEEIFVIPVFYTKQWLVWKDKKNGGGFFGAHDSQEEAQARVNKEGGEKQGVEAVDTPQHLCLILNRNSGSVDEIMIPMARTKNKVSRAWNSIIRLAGGDRFSRVYKITTVEEKNDKGDFYNYSITGVGFPPEPLYKRAEELYERIAAGAKKVVMHVDDDANEAERAGM